MSTQKDNLELATFGAGCFWCLDAIARLTPGITSSVVGYAGGPGPAPTYEELHRSGGEYIEAIQLTFNTGQLDYRGVLDLFFHSHDPTTPNQDGANYGPEYNSTIFFHSDIQRKIAHAVAREEEVELERPVITEIRPFTTFFPAESEHQDFFNSNPRHPYCTFVIRPKLKRLGMGS
jgi:peptide-methionine (S)-S-oxide reductase